MSSSTIGAYEAKTHLPRLLDEVEDGATITITKHGRPVARLVPISARTSAPDAAVDALLANRVGTRRGKVTVRRMIDEGRR